MASGTILENLSNRKLFALISVLFLIQIISFIIGAFYTPSPTNTESYSAIKCLPQNRSQLSVPRVYLPNGEVTHQNCLLINRSVNESIVFAVQMPLPRDGFQLDYSRWMQSLIVLLEPDFVYEEALATGTSRDLLINGTIVMHVTLAARSRFESEWRVYAQKSSLKRSLSCSIEHDRQKTGHRYDCNSLQLYELQSVFYDYYLLNIKIEGEQQNQVYSAVLQDLNLIAIHQNGGFTQIWLALKSFFTFMSLFSLVFFVLRLKRLPRSTNLIERFLFFTGLALVQLNIPLEYLTLWFDFPFMNFLSDLRQGIFYCITLCFWLVFVGEHALQDSPLNSRSFSSYYRAILIVFCGCIALFMFDSAERGVQAFDPFFTVWEMQSLLPTALIFIGFLCATVYVAYLIYQIVQVFKTISGRQQTLPRTPLARRLTYHGIVYRFKFLMYTTGFCGVATVISFFYSQIREEQMLSLSIDDPPLQYSSAMYASVYALWNCYTVLLLCMYAPSAKCFEVDNTSEEIEFTRLGDYGDDISITSTTRSVRRTERTPKKGKKSELELLTEMATKPSFD